MSGLRRFEARWVVPAIGEILSPGALAVEQGSVVAVGSPEEVWEQTRHRPGAPGAVVDLGEAVIFPGLINAHAHLDYTCLRGALLPPKSFTSWLDRVGQIKRSLSDEDFLESLHRGLHEAAISGTTSLCSIESFPQLLPRLPPPRIRVWWFYELSDLRHRHHPDDLIRGSLMFFEQQSGWRGGFGLSPHAPYTASAGLYQLSRTCATKYGMPWTTHVAESSEEMAMFAQRQGPLFDFLSSLGRDMGDTGPHCSPLRQVLGATGNLDNAILVHLNYLDEGDWRLLRAGGASARAAPARVVHCPSSHRFFGHSPFPEEGLRAVGARIALATDSGATGGSLDLREELRLFQESRPEMPATELWKMVTTIPAEFLGRGQEAGHLRPGAWADFVVFRPPAEPATVPVAESFWQCLIDDRRLPLSVWVEGRPVAGVVASQLK